MPTITSTGIGVASVQTDTFDTIEVLSGDTPQIVTDYGILAAPEAAAGIPAWTPVFVDAGTKAVSLAVSGTTEPNAITVEAIPAGSSTGVTVPVYKAGSFNFNAINWPASYSTDALKFAAFSTTDCEIYVKKPFYG